MASNTEFVVITINAGGARRAVKDRLDLAQIASDLSQLISSTIGRPDIIAVQESHQVWHPRQSSPLGTSQAMAQRLGPSYRSYFLEYLDSDSHAHPNKWDQPLFSGFNRVQQGNAVIISKSLTQWPWGSPPAGYPGKLAPISTQISRAALYSTGNRDTEPRNLVVVPLSFGQRASLYFMATHLTTLKREDRHDSRNPESQRASNVRLAQVHEVLQIVDELRKAERDNEQKPVPIILAGDFNAKPGSPELVALEQTFLLFPPRWHDESIQRGLVWTHVGHKIHVDHIFYNDPDGLLTPVDCFVPDPIQVGNITDHLPVIAKFKIQQEEDEQREQR